MMFSRVNQNKVISSEGFTVEISGRFSLMYRDDSNNSYEIYIEPLAIMEFCMNSLTEKNLPEEKIRKIISDINDAADFLGWNYVWYTADSKEPMVMQRSSLSEEDIRSSGPKFKE